MELNCVLTETCSTEAHQFAYTVNRAGQITSAYYKYCAKIAAVDIKWQHFDSSTDKKGGGGVIWALYTVSIVNFVLNNGYILSSLTHHVVFLQILRQL